MSHEHGPSLDLFAARSTTISSLPTGGGGPPRSMTATASGMPPEWSPFAMDTAFASRKAARKDLAPEEVTTLVRAMWTFAIARHNALLAMKSAQGAAAALCGHRSLDDELERALRVIETYRIEPSDIPAAKAFDVRLDLRPLAGEQPFPLPADAQHQHHPHNLASGDD